MQMNSRPLLPLAGSSDVRCIVETVVVASSRVVDSYYDCQVLLTVAAVAQVVGTVYV
jgi:hypothetical protein